MTKTLLSLLCLASFACEAPIDLGDRGTPSGGSSSYTSNHTQPGTGGSPIETGTGAMSRCGDGRVDPGEVCDDGNVQSGDGCSADCREREVIDPARCGDGRVDPGEVCDDGNTDSGDGCSADCRELEAGYACALPGAPCQVSAMLVNCGNGLVEADESCDDGNRSDDDGCSSRCQLEAGWTCESTPMSVCVELCGDGVVTPGEECDLGTGNGDPVGGCGLDCRVLSICGDGKVSAGEQCDNGSMNNDQLYGSCRTDCRIGPYCGDAIVNGPEQCDDGVNDGSHGCQPACTIGG